MVAMGLLLVALVPLILLRAFVFLKLWAWFIVPVFGLPALGYASAIGLSLVAAMLQNHNVAKEKHKSDDPLEQVLNFISNSAAGSLLFLLFGWIVSWWM